MGIGTASPAMPLHVKGPNGVIMVEGSQSAMQHRDSDGALRFLTGLRSDVTNNTTNYVFYSYGGHWAFAGTGGNVGIGTTSPGEKLEVNGNLKFSGNANIYTTGGTGQLWLGGGSQGTLSLQTNNGQINFYSGAGGGTAIGALSNVGNLQVSGTLSADGTGNSYLKGNVGIGTTAPGGQLHVVGTGAGGQVFVDGTTAAPEFALRRDQVLANGNVVSRLLSQGKDAGGTMRNFWDVYTLATDVTAGAQKGDLVWNSYTGVTPAERMRLTQAGSLGIGTTSPSDVLDVRTGNNGAGLTISAPNNAAAGSQPALVFKRYSAGTISTVAKIVSGECSTGAPTCGDLAFQTGTSGSPTNTMVMNSANNVGIGTTNPAGKLHVSGGHIHVSGTVPGVSGCGTAPTIQGNDVAGKITIGGGPGTSCNLTFASAWPTAPVCTAIIDGNLGPFNAGTTTTGITFSSNASLNGGARIYYICLGL